MITYQFTLSIGYGGEHKDEWTVGDMGYDDTQWNHLTDTEKDKKLSESWQEWANNYIDGGWILVD